MNLLRKLRSSQRSALTLADPDGWPPEYMYVGAGTGDGRERPVGDFATAARRIYKASGPISALMDVRMRVFSDIRFQFQRMRDGTAGDLFGTAELGILERPWPGGTTRDLLSRMIQDADLAGNSFWTVNRRGHLKRLRPDWVTIVVASEDEPHLYGDAIDGEIIGYIYAPRGGDETILLPEDVCHFAPKPDPEFQYRGMSWLTPIISEIFADQAATEHKRAFYRSGATPRYVVKANPAMPVEKFQRFRAAMEQVIGGTHNAYRTIYLGGGADVMPIGTDMRQLDFKVVQGAGETRLANAAGVPAVIAGFSEGLQGSSLNAGNYSAAKRQFADGTIRNLWGHAAGSLETLLTLPGPDTRLWYDERDVEFLRDDKRDEAEIASIESGTIRRYLDAGFEPDSVIAAVRAGDLTLLKHSGLYSVQLQEPQTGQPQPVAAAGTDPAAIVNPPAIEAPKKTA